MHDFKTIVASRPVIAACRPEGIRRAVDSGATMVLLMNATLTWLIKPEFQELRERKPILIHTDLLKGLAGDRDSILFLRDFVRPWGIVSTRNATVRAALKEGVPAIQRVFLIDSTALRNSLESIRENRPSAVELMPGTVPGAPAEVKDAVDLPVISAGLIRSSADVDAAFRAGADAVSMSLESLWEYVPPGRPALPPT